MPENIAAHNVDNNIATPAASWGRRGVMLGGAGVAGWLAWQAAHPMHEVARAGSRVMMLAPDRTADWTSWKERFLQADGRVIDVDNAGVSHSEGQGYGMLFAEAAGDRLSFDRILAWTTTALRRPDDNLLSWRYRPGAAEPVEDKNNATDGDIYVAWALLRAGQRWGGDYDSRARAISRDILRLTVIEVGRRTLMLPGVSGFRQQEEVVINPSYYVFPALQAFTSDPAWRRVAAGGVELLREGRFGRYQLPPDWLAVPRADIQLRPATGKPARFGYDAGRIPLHLMLGGLSREPAVTAAATLWSAPASDGIPAWAELRNGLPSAQLASTGQQAIALLTIQAANRKPLREIRLPLVSDATGYFSASLTMLARLAAVEAHDVVGFNTRPATG